MNMPPSKTAKPDNRKAGSGQRGQSEAPLTDDSRIRKLQSRANSGLIAIALFMAISIGAIRDFDFIPPLPDALLDILGTPPSAKMISAALIVYTFAAIVLILARMMSGAGIQNGISQVGYLTAFYAFYHFANAMEDCFWAVFAAGVTILALNGYHTWTHCMEEIVKVQDRIKEAERKRNQGGPQLEE
jgi:hypothetical protein